MADHIQPSLGLGYLAAQIRRDHDVVIHDCIKENTSIGEIKDIIGLFDPDLIGVQCYTFNTPKVYQMLKIVKEAFPDKVTVVGGAHISSIPAVAFHQFRPYANYVFNLKVLFVNVLAIKSFNHFRFLVLRFYHWILMRPKGGNCLI